MSLSTETIPVIDSIAPLGKGYAAWLVDIWGVMHNGVRAFPPAVEATRRYREQGGIVILLSNSPRPSKPPRSCACPRSQVASATPSCAGSS